MVERVTIPMNGTAGAYLARRIGLGSVSFRSAGASFAGAWHGPATAAGAWSNTIAFLRRGSKA